MGKIISALVLTPFSTVSKTAHKGPLKAVNTTTIPFVYAMGRVRTVAEGVHVIINFSLPSSLMTFLFNP